jgi:hypothetical protein
MPAWAPVGAWVAVSQLRLGAKAAAQRLVQRASKRQAPPLMSARATGLGVLLFGECESLLVRRTNSASLLRVSAVVRPISGSAGVC